MALMPRTLALTARELKADPDRCEDRRKYLNRPRDELVLTLRTRTETYALLLSARSSCARVCLTEESFENPRRPPRSVC